MILHKILIGVLCCFLMGCASSKYLERKQYLLDTPKSLVKKHKSVTSCSVFVEHVLGVSPFDQLDFIYRVESGRYLVDYYHGFLASPIEQLDDIVRAYLRAYSNCNLEITKSVVSHNFLQVTLVELYADYRERNNPKAVIALEFHLTTSQDEKNEILLDRILRASVSLKEKSTDGLLNAWNEGVRDILTQGSRVLNQILKEQK